MRLILAVILTIALLAIPYACQRDANPVEALSSGETILAGKGGNSQKVDCISIQDGILETSDGRIIETGYDEWGYNYQAHMFNGGYCDAYRDAAWCQPYKDIRLIMKWNESWLSNKDCDGDGLLDRHFGYDSYIGSGAWTTNHQFGEYVDEEGNTCQWDYFVKIVAAPFDATSTDGVWYAADGTEIGPVIWGEFAVIQEVYNEPCAGVHGIEYLSPVGPGFGKFNKTKDVIGDPGGPGGGF
jgi:hypothetical protein